MSCAVQIEIVGDEAIGGSGDLHLLDHRVTPLNNFDVRAVFKLGTAVVAIGSERGKRSEYIDFRQRQRGLPDASRLGGDSGAQLCEQAPLDLDYLLLGVEHLDLVLLQLWRGKALGVDQGLLTFVLPRREVQVRLGDLEVIAEDAVELDLQRTDAGPLAFALLDLCDVLLAVTAQVAKFVESRIDPRADDTAVRQRKRRLIFERRHEPVTQVSQFVTLRMQSQKTLGREGRQHGAHRRQLSERCCERQQVWRIGRFQSHAAQQPLQIENASQRATEFFPGDHVLHHAFDSVEPSVDLAGINRRAQHPGAQQAFAHRGNGAVQTAEQRRIIGGAGEQRLDQLKIAYRDRVQHQAVLPLVEANAVHMIERATLRRANVMQNRSRRSCCRRPVRQSESFQREHAKMVFDLRNGVVGREHPIVERRLGPGGIFQRRDAGRRSGYGRRSAAAGLVEEGKRRREQHLARTEHQQLLTHAALGVFALKFGRTKFAGRKVQGREAESNSCLRHATQKIILFRSEMRVSRGAWREHTRDFALHQRFGYARVFHLFADGDLEAFADQLADVVLGGVVWHAAHRYGNAFFLVARGQRDLQLPRREHGVLEEEFVEVAQPEEDERVGMVFLDRGILPHQRGGRLSHRIGANCADYNTQE